MPLPSSGAISISQIAAEFGGSAPHSLSEYYRGGGLVPDTPANALIPISGAIKLSDFYGAVAFSPVTRTYTSGIGATETVPAGASLVRIRVGGGGGAGGLTSEGSPDVGGGGGEGGWAEKTIAVTGGNTFTYTVGGIRLGRSTPGIGANGNASSVSGTVAGGSVSINAGGGTGGGTLSGGAGGTATGGDTNVTGADGEDGSLGGAGGTGASTQSGAGGAGDTVLSGIGASGPGERGEIEFYYT